MIDPPLTVSFIVTFIFHGANSSPSETLGCGDSETRNDSQGALMRLGGRNKTARRVVHYTRRNLSPPLHPGRALSESPISSSKWNPTTEWPRKAIIDGDFAVPIVAGAHWRRHTQNK